jgi:hypothetical protein
MGKWNYKNIFLLAFIIILISLSTQSIIKDKSNISQISNTPDTVFLTDTYMEEQENDSELDIFFNLSLYLPFIFCVFSYFHFTVLIVVLQKFYFHQFSIPPPVLL